LGIFSTTAALAVTSIEKEQAHTNQSMTPVILSEKCTSC